MSLISRLKGEEMKQKVSTNAKYCLSQPFKEVDSSESRNKNLVASKMYKNLVEMAHEGITMVDPEDNITFANRQFAKSLGYKPSELVGRSVYSLATKTSAARMKKGTEMRRKGRRSRYEVTLLHRDGSRRVFRLAASPIYGSSREFIGSMGVYADVTEMKAMDYRLKRKVRQINALYRVYHHARMNRPLNAVFNSIAQEVVQVLPYDECIQSRLIFDGKVFAYPRKFKAFIKKIETPIVVSGVHRGVLEVGYTERMPSVPHDEKFKEERELIANVGGILSKHLQARNVLERHQEIVSRSFTGIVITVEGVIRYANVRFCRMFKSRKVRVMGEKMEVFLPNFLPSKMSGSKVKHCRGVRSNGEELDLAVIVQKIEYRGESATLVRISDISDLKSAQRKLSSFNRELRETVKEKTRHLEEANKRLQSLNLLKDEFIAITSHELRSPLTSIRGYLSFLVEEDSISQLSEPYREYLIRAYSTTDSLNYLINNILDVSRLDMGRFQLQKLGIDMIRLTQSILDSLSYQFNERKLQLEFSNETGQEEFFLRVDSIRMSQVLRNILDNSIKFTKRGKKISVTIDAVPGHLRIAVADEGVGIPATKLDVVFDKFMQVKNTHTKYKGGVGLGLFIAKRIVELHHGHIEASKNSAKGTTISIFLPIDSTE